MHGLRTDFVANLDKIFHLDKDFGYVIKHKLRINRCK